MEMVAYMQNLSTKVVQIGLRVCSFKMSIIWQKFIKKGMLWPKIICKTFIFDEAEQILQKMCVLHKMLRK